MMDLEIGVKGIDKDQETQDTHRYGRHRLLRFRISTVKEDTEDEAKNGT